MAVEDLPTESQDSFQSSNKCPVKHSNYEGSGGSTAGTGTGTGAGSANSNEALASKSWWNMMFSPPAASVNTPFPSKSKTPSSTTAADVELGTMVPSIEESAGYTQTPQLDQRVRLNTVRDISSIPRGASVLSGDSTQHEPTLPEHQPSSESSTSSTTKNSPHWVYPSEQQMYNAMRRKGWSNVPEDSIPMVLQIHNSINERTWRQIQDWEGFNPLQTNKNNNNTTAELRLASFQGRPNDVSPKAFFWCYLMRLYEPPFDRHDWYVVQHQQQSQQPNAVATEQTKPPKPSSVPPPHQQRYVIDYYYLPPTHPDMPPIPYVDARPAWDHPVRALGLYGRRFLREAFPGITATLRLYQQRQEARAQQAHVEPSKRE